MKRALPFNEQVDVSSDESSSSDEYDHKAESEQMNNNITGDEVVDELVSEGTTIICDHLDTVKCESKQMNNNFNIGQGVDNFFLKVMVFNAETILRKARMYQEYMKMVPMPTETGCLIPYTSWRGLAESIKMQYGQPLHYLTNLCMKQWDQMRHGAENEDEQLDMLIHPTKAESIIWRMEEVNRRTASPVYFARLWLADPMYHAYIDAIFPKLQDPPK